MQLFGLQGGLSGLSGQPGVGGASRPASPLAPSPGTLLAKVDSGVQFRPGQVLFGTVAGRQKDGTFLLRFGAQTLTASSRVGLDVGQPLQVQVQGQQQGQLRLQVMKSLFAPMSGQDVGQALSGLKQPLTEANVGLATSMVEHGIPLTRENLASLKSALAQLPPESAAGLPQPARVGAAWFLQSSQLPLTPQNISTLGHFIAANPQLGQQLFLLQGELRRMVENPQRRAGRTLEMLAEVPGLLGEFLLEPGGGKKSGRAGRRLFDLARQAGIETHVALQSGSEPDWDLLAVMRDLRAALAGQDSGLEGVLGLMAGLEENLRALQLINQARPDAGLAFYYLQVPLRLDRGESAEIWIRYRIAEDGSRLVDPEDLRIEFLVSTQNLGNLSCTLEVARRTVHVDLGSDCEEVRLFVERSLEVLAERIAESGWLPGRLGATLRPFTGRPLVDRQDLESLETVNVQA